MVHAVSRRLVVLGLFTAGLFLLGWVEAGALVSKTFSFSTSDLSFSEIQGYDLASLPGCTHMGDVGKPALPVMMVSFAIPTNNTVTGFTISGEQTEEVSGTYLIYPAQELAPTDGSPPPDFVPPDPSVYGSSDPFPGILVELSNEGYFAGSKIATICVYPLQWVPTTGKLTLSTDFTVTLELGPSEDWSQPVGRRTQEMHDRYIQLAKELVENPEQVEAFANQPEIVDESEFGDQGPHTCIIITPQAFQEQFEPLRDWNRRRGLRTQIHWVEWIVANYPAYDDPHSIRNLIKEYYSNYGTEWVLLAGDAQNVPVRIRDYREIPADVYYSALDGTWDINGNHLYGDFEITGPGGEREFEMIDYRPEVWVGRAQVEDQAEAELFVNKVVAYQQDPQTYLGPRDFLLMGAWMDEQGTSGGTIKNVVLSQVPTQATLWRMYDGNYVPPPAPDQDIGYDAAMQRLQQGFYLTNHFGHGDYGKISVGYDDKSPYIYNADLDILTNDGHGVFYSTACYSAPFDQPSDQCFAKHWLTNPVGGGVAYLGESRAGHYYPTNPGHGLSAVMDGLFLWYLCSDYTIENTRAIGRALATAKNQYSYPQQLWLETYELSSLNLLGDPTMPVWTEEPLALSVSHPAFIPAGFPIDFTVSVTDEFGPVQNAWVCLYREGHIREVEYTDASGTAVIPLSLTSEQMGEMLVTVSKVARVPYLGSCWITLGTTSPQGTALNNAKRFLRTHNQFSVLFTSDEPERVYHGCSSDPQGIWLNYDIGSGKYGALSLGRDLWPPPLLKAVWCDGNVLHYRSRNELGGWLAAHTLFVEELPLTGVSAPSFAIDTLLASDIAFVAWQSVGYEGTPSVFRKYYLGCFEPWSGSSPPPFQYVVFDELTGPAPPLEHTGPSIGIDSDAQTPQTRPCVHIAWEKNGEVYYRVVSPDGMSQIVNISESPTVPSEHPSLDIHQSVVRIVWEEEGDILYRSIVGGVPGEIENASQSAPLAISVRPVVERSFVAWSEQVLTDYDILLRRRGISGWTDAENVSNSPLAPSMHPQLLYREVPDQVLDEVHIIWTEGTESPYCIRFDERAVQPEQVYPFNLGEEEPSLVTVQRDGYVQYGSWWMYETLDYDSTMLIYHLAGLDPGKNYKLEAIYYHRFGDTLRERIEVDQEIAEEAVVPSDTPVTVTVDLPVGCVVDGELVVTVSELSGELGICSMLILYEYESPRSARGSQALGVGSLAPRVFALSQNYPNPATGTTTIRYQLSEGAETGLRIYDVTGRLVRELVNERQDPGYYVTTWDGRDEAGRRLASGVYFYRFTANHFTAAKKMLVLR